MFYYKCSYFKKIYWFHCVIYCLAISWKYIFWYLMYMFWSYSIKILSPTSPRTSVSHTSFPLPPSYLLFLIYFYSLRMSYMYTRYFDHVLTPFSNFLRPSSTHPLYQLHVLLIFNNPLSPITAYHKCMGKLLVMATHPKKNNSLPPQPVAPHPDHCITCSSHVHYHLLFHLLPLKIIYLFQLVLFACTWVWGHTPEHRQLSSYHNLEVC